MESNEIDKIDVEELIKDFKVFNIDTFATYLKEVWKVLSFNIRIWLKGVIQKLKGLTK
jgi:hypothetical protein